MPRLKKVSKKEKKVEPRKSEVDLTIPVYDLGAKETGSLELPKEIFAVEASPKLLAQYVRVYLANKRQGTASTKTRGEVKGSTRKIYRQKGTGRARHGDIKAPIFVGGGIVGGPKPKDYSLKLNKKQKRRALFSALSLKLKEKSIIGVESKETGKRIKTKSSQKFLNLLGFNRQQVLLVITKQKYPNLYLSFRNLGNTCFIDANSINAYEVLKNQKILVTKETLETLKKNYLNSKQN